MRAQTDRRGVLLRCEFSTLELMRSSRRSAVCVCARWLNNCVGKANYRYFVTTVGLAVVLTAAQLAVTLGLIAQYCMDRHAFDRAGLCVAAARSFSPFPFINLPCSCSSRLTLALLLVVPTVSAFHPSLAPKAVVGLLALTALLIAPLFILVTQLSIFHAVLSKCGCMLEVVCSHDGLMPRQDASRFSLLTSQSRCCCCILQPFVPIAQPLVLMLKFGCCGVGDVLMSGWVATEVQGLTTYEWVAREQRRQREREERRRNKVRTSQ